MGKTLIFKKEAKGFAVFFVLALSLILLNTSKLYAFSVQGTAESRTNLISLTLDGTPLDYNIYSILSSAATFNSTMTDQNYDRLTTNAHFMNTDSFGFDNQSGYTNDSIPEMGTFASAASTGLFKYSEGSAEQSGSFYVPSAGMVNMQVSYVLKAETNWDINHVDQDAYAEVHSLIWLNLGDNISPQPDYGIDAGSYFWDMAEESSGTLSIDYFSPGNDWASFDIWNMSYVWAGYPNYQVNPQVPEPATMVLLGSLASGLFGFAGLRKRLTK